MFKQAGGGIGTFVDEQGAKIDFFFSKDCMSYKKAGERYLIPYEAERGKAGVSIREVYVTAASSEGSLGRLSDAITTEIQQAVMDAAKVAGLSLYFAW
jgi:hypothetical protein